jgi:Ca2+-binding RTX toxin-like protein
VVLAVVLAPAPQASSTFGCCARSTRVACWKHVARSTDAARDRGNGCPGARGCGAGVATFAGENGRIAFEGPNCCGYPDPEGFYTMKPDGSDVRVTPVGLKGVHDVAWSPDGKRVAFTAVSDDPEPEGNEDNSFVTELYVANADGSDVQRLTFNDSGERSPSWSPDGKWLSVLTGTWTTRDRLAVISAAGGDMRFLRDADSIMAEWSPTEDVIAIAEPLSGIELVPAGGGDATTIVPDANVRQFSWAPTGKRLVFQRCDQCALYEVNSDGSDVEPLVASGDPGAPTWSPDGESVTFCRSVGDEYGFYSVGANGGEPQLVTGRAAPCPHWQSWQPLPRPAQTPPAGACPTAVHGTRGPDSMEGDRDRDRLLGLGGADQLFGRGGADCLSGGPGADLAMGGRGADVVRGGPGDDRLEGGADRDTIYAGPGRDRVDAGAGDDLVDARGGGGDTVDCGDGDDRAMVSKSDTVRGCEHVARASQTTG